MARFPSFFFTNDFLITKSQIYVPCEHFRTILLLMKYCIEYFFILDFETIFFFLYIFFYYFLLLAKVVDVLCRLHRPIFWSVAPLSGWSASNHTHIWLLVLISIKWMNNCLIIHRHRQWRLLWCERA